MSYPTSATTPYTNYPQHHGKSASSLLRTSQDKLGGTIHTTKYELKSLAENIASTLDKNSRMTQHHPSHSHQTQPSYSQQLHSPNESPRKPPNQQQGSKTTKNMNMPDKKSSMLLSLETLDLKDGLAASKKVYPLTSKHMKPSSYQINQPEKTTTKTVTASGVKKSSSTKPKDEKVRALLTNYEAIFDQTSPQHKEITKLGLGFDPKERERKSHFMEEPPKKQSLPNNLALNLNTIYSSTGSASHRVPMNSPSSELINVIDGKKGVRASRKSNVDVLDYPNMGNLGAPNSTKGQGQQQQQQQTELIAQPGGANGQGQGQGYSFNNLFIDLATISHDPLKNISKISINNINNINTINNGPSAANNMEERLGSQENSTTYSSKDILSALVKKNEEIQSLTKEKTELKGILEALVYEINDLKRAKNSGKGKEEALESLKESIFNILGTSISDKDDTSKLNSISTTQHGPSQFQRKKRSGSNSSSSDFDSIKSRFIQQKTISDSSDEIISRALEQKDSLLEALTKKSHRVSKGKSPTYSSTTSYLTAGEDLNEKISVKSGHQQQTPGVFNSYNIYKRSLSGTGEDLLGKKAKESPYYEALKAPTSTKKAATLKSSGINTGIKKSYGNLEAFKKEEAANSKKATKGHHMLNKPAGLFIETPDKLEIDAELGNELIRVPPKTTSNADLEMLRRKFSHDPNGASETIFELFRKKHAVLHGGFEGGRNTQKSEGDEQQFVGLDIGKSLGMLRDRIAGMLGRYRDDRDRTMVKKQNNSRFTKAQN